MKKNLIVLTTGGTGGHIFPAEALAAELLKRKYDLALLTDKRAKSQLPETLSKIPVYFIKAEAITGRGFFKKMWAAFKLFIGTLQALVILIRLQPKAVVCFGSYASVPTGLAAQFLYIPVFLHEQNAVLGRANRLLSRKIKFIATSFTPTSLIPQHIQTIQTGMPVRQAILNKIGTPYPKNKEDFHLLVMGGSQGARAFSTVIPKALDILPPYLKAKLSLTQQVRAEDMPEVEEAYRNSGIKSVTLAPFFNNVADLLVATHLVISRSGSSSLAEFSALGKPALLVPLPTSADDHQTANARSFTEKGGGWLMVERNFTPDALAARLTELMENYDVLKETSMNALDPSAAEASKKLADAIIQTIKKGTK